MASGQVVFKELQKSRKFSKCPLRRAKCIQNEDNNYPSLVERRKKSVRISSLRKKLGQVLSKWFTLYSIASNKLLLLKSYKCHLATDSAQHALRYIYQNYIVVERCGEKMVLTEWLLINLLKAAKSKEIMTRYLTLKHVLTWCAMLWVLVVYRIKRPH